MDDEELVHQLGLLLTQTRFARRALEDIERSTASYGTFAFTSVITAGPRFGTAPLQSGALMVHVVNLSDLEPGRGFGDFLQGLLGGVGALIGNVGGGLLGGTAGSLLVAWHLPTILNIANSVERILMMIGVGAPKVGTAVAHPPAAGGVTVPTLAAAPGTAAAPPGPPGAATALGQWGEIRAAVETLTGLFLAATTPGRPGGPPGPEPTPQGARWLRMLDDASISLERIGRLVDGLVIALPMTIGSLSWLLAHLPDMRLAIAETLRFALRIAFLLRGAVTLTVFDTLAMVARMAAGVAAVLASTLQGILSAVFATVREALLAVFDLGSALGAAIGTAVNQLLNWLVPTVDTILRNFAELRVFRVLTHLIRILPAVLPALVQLKTGKPIEDAQLVKDLHEAAQLKFLEALAPGAAGTPAKPPEPPDLGAALRDAAVAGRAMGALERLQQATGDGLRFLNDSVQGGMRALGDELDTVAERESTLSDQALGRQLATLREHSTDLAGNLVVEAARKPSTGLETVADAYEKWLTGGGLATILTTITRHLGSERGEPGAFRPKDEGPPGDRARATIVIDEVVIEVGGAPGPAGPPSPDEPAPGRLDPGDFPPPPDRDDMERYARMRFDYDLRGGSGRLPLPT
ncbi:hypothetical protein [Streptomyces sp. NBC_01445]|uniref:hypothetical protein n=1 Tax=Streptomyces sp. NBC_01445 TaxID=2903869 RepID=UPI002DDA537E|nr:hypothetical protein [Streptomyces sp. NBC_01445]WSE03781.1 hypothetical protein OG574_10615 [Streptomyces sp. NBC_01445]